MKLFFYLVLFAATIDAAAQVSLPFSSPASPSSDDEVTLTAYVWACFHSDAQSRMPRLIQVRYSADSVVIDMEQNSSFGCFAAGDPLTPFPYVIELGRLAAGRYTLQLNHVHRLLVPAINLTTTLTVSAGSMPPPAPEADAMQVLPSVLRYGQVATVKLPLRECRTSSGRERTWSPSIVPGSTSSFSMLQPANLCQGTGTPDSVFFLSSSYTASRPGWDALLYGRGTFLGSSPGSPSGPTQYFEARVKVELGSTTTAVEYFHAEFGHYFVTILPDEIYALDYLRTGWSRTFKVFNVHYAQGPGLVPVCRFFTTAFPPKSSHFYAPRTLGCEGTLGNKDWQFEGNVFYAALPDSSGACPEGTSPVYRLYNNGQGGAPNHRFTTSLAVREQMIASGYVPEGAGIGVGMCTAD